MYVTIFNLLHFVFQIYYILKALDKVTMSVYTIRLYLWANHLKRKKIMVYFLRFASETVFDLTVQRYIFYLACSGKQCSVS